MLLAIEIGNSSMSIGLFCGALLKGRLRLPSHPYKTIREYRDEIDAFLSREGAVKPLTGVIVSSVVSELGDLLNHAARGLSRGDPLTLNISLKTGLHFDIEKPDEIGADRIANVVAASAIHGADVVVADFGTATTLSAARDNRFIGGAILPGTALMADALYTGTSKLPAIDVNLLTPLAFHPPAVGKDTTKCIISGIIYGTAGAVERLAGEMEREEGCTFSLVLTGGSSGFMSSFIRRDFFLEPDLTLHGLRLIYERNS